MGWGEQSLMIGRFAYQVFYLWSSLSTQALHFKFINTFEKWEREPSVKQESTELFSFAGVRKVVWRVIYLGFIVGVFIFLSSSTRALSCIPSQFYISGEGLAELLSSPDWAQVFDLPFSVFQSTGITGVYHHTWLHCTTFWRQRISRRKVLHCNSCWRIPKWVLFKWYKGF